MAAVEEPRTTDAERDELEALWEAPAAERPRRVDPGRARELDDLAAAAGTVLLHGWGWLIAAVVLLAPAPAEGASFPWWSSAAQIAFVLAVPAGFALALCGLPVLGVVLASWALGVFGMVVSYGCRATAHHAGAWWLVELGGTAALTAVAGVLTYATVARRRLG